jgi:hypothetical protein
MVEMLSQKWYGEITPSLMPKSVTSLLRALLSEYLWYTHTQPEFIVNLRPIIDCSGTVNEPYYW